MRAKSITNVTNRLQDEHLSDSIPNLTKGSQMTDTQKWKKQTNQVPQNKEKEPRHTHSKQTHTLNVKMNEINIIDYYNTEKTNKLIQHPKAYTQSKPNKKSLKSSTKLAKKTETKKTKNNIRITKPTHAYISKKLTKIDHELTGIAGFLSKITKNKFIYLDREEIENTERINHLGQQSHPLEPSRLQNSRPFKLSNQLEPQSQIQDPTRQQKSSPSQTLNQLESQSQLKDSSRQQKSSTSQSSNKLELHSKLTRKM